MKLVRWTRFTWDLKKLPKPAQGVNAHYNIRPCNADEEATVRKIIHASFALDTDWNDALNGMRPRFEAAIDALFQAKPALCLALTHGSRIIGASLMTPQPSADNHLVTGPCVSVEYRNRGLGTSLLHESLHALREAGLSTACGITKSTLASARFVYPKFGSKSEPCEFSVSHTEQA